MYALRGALGRKGGQEQTKDMPEPQVPFTVLGPAQEAELRVNYSLLPLRSQQLFHLSL